MGGKAEWCGICAHVMDAKEFIFSIFQENIYIKKKTNSLKSHKAGKLYFAFHSGVGNRKGKEEHASEKCLS